MGYGKSLGAVLPVWLFRFLFIRSSFVTVSPLSWQCCTIGGQLPLHSVLQHVWRQLPYSYRITDITETLSWLMPPNMVHNRHAWDKLLAAL